jgi:hypothetical protein
MFDVAEIKRLFVVVPMLPVETKVVTPSVGAPFAGGDAFGEYGLLDERLACIPHFQARYASIRCLSVVVRAVLYITNS